MVFSILNFRKELKRSKCITKSSNEISKEIEEQYKKLSEKYNLAEEENKMYHWSKIRKNIVQNFVDGLREAETSLENCRYIDNFKKRSIKQLLRGFKNLESRSFLA